MLIRGVRHTFVVALAIAFGTIGVTAALAAPVAVNGGANNGDIESALADAGGGGSSSPKNTAVNTEADNVGDSQSGGLDCDPPLDSPCDAAHPNNCYWETQLEQPKTAADLAALKASSGMEPPPEGIATQQVLQIRVCSLPRGDGSPPVRRWVTPEESAPPLPPPDPAVLAASATKLLKLPALDPKIGPGVENAVVHKPLWLWVDDPGPQTSSLTLRGVTVTVNAHITKVNWSMGEPVDNPEAGQSAIQQVSCDGPGQAAPPRAQLPADPIDWKPGCGYTYQWISKKARTNGAGRWPVTATIQWTADWTSNIGPAGSIVLTMDSQTSVEVGEIRTVMVNDPNAPLAPGG